MSAAIVPRDDNLPIIGPFVSERAAVTFLRERDPLHSGGWVQTIETPEEWLAGRDEPFFKAVVEVTNR